MRVPSHPTQIRQMLQSRLKLLAPSGPVLAASLIRLNKRCGQPSCRCHHDGHLHPAYHLTYRQGGQTRTAYAPKDLAEEARTWIADHPRLNDLTQEVSKLAAALL